MQTSSSQSGILPTSKTIARPDLKAALLALRGRNYFVAYPEHTAAYPDNENAAGKLDFEQRLNQPYSGLLQPGTLRYGGEEISPWTRQKLGITYALSDPEALLLRARSARHGLRELTIEQRATILIDALEQLRKHFFELAYATMHTSGQSFSMAFQASGPHAADRALEAMTAAYDALKAYPGMTTWEKPMGKTSVRLQKTYKPIGRGIALCIGCSTFPTWNTLPGVFANLMCGNPVIWKPHPAAILPAAIAASCIQQAFANAGADPLVLQLAPDTSTHPIALELAQHPLVQLIDYTGNSIFGQTLETLPGKIVFTEKAGVNCVLLESTTDLNGVLNNLAFSVALYSGQMCTAPQNFFIPEQGVWNGTEFISFDEVCERFKAAVTALVNNPKMGVGTLATIQNENTLLRIKNAGSLGAKILLASDPVSNAEFPDARAVTPLLLKTDYKQESIYSHELFGPISVLIKGADRDETLSCITGLSRKQGAITCALHTTDPVFEQKALRQLEDAFVPVSVNLNGLAWVNQHAAFSDLHVTGGNPAGNACMTTADFVNRRFVWVGSRKMG
jgi:phenylacetic acid degradation protein paaN